MAKEDKEVSNGIGWVLGSAGTLLSLLIGVFLVGWNARGQTAKILAVEVKTDNLKEDFGQHCEMQATTTKEVRKTLSALDKSMSNQQVILSNIEKKL